MRNFRFYIFVFFTLTYTSVAARVVIDDPVTDQKKGYQVNVQNQEPQSYWDALKAKAGKKLKAWWDSSDEKPATVQSAKTKPEKKVVAAPVVEPKVDLTKDMPEYKSKEINNYKKIISDTDNVVKGLDAIQEVSPGRVGTSNLPKTKRGVPRFSLYDKKKIKTKKGKAKLIRIYKKEIPLLDIGEEPKISSQDFITPEMSLALDMFDDPKALKSPKRIVSQELSKWLRKKIALARRPKVLQENQLGLGKIVTRKKVGKVTFDMQASKELETIKPIKPYSKNELNMLAALILYSKGDNCHVVTGLLADLEKKTKFKQESNFYLGQCAHEMGFHSEAVNRLLKVIKSKNPDFVSPAIESLVERLPKEYEKKVGIVLENSLKFITDKAKDGANYIMAKSNFRRKQYIASEKYAKQVSAKSSSYLDAKYLAAVSQYSQGYQTRAINSLEGLRKWMDKHNKNDKNIESLIAINLGRIKFRKGKYKEAHQDYLKIRKDHPLWVQGLIEQGWTQLQIADYSGAIGNMYSLHSPYFRVVYMPESYVVRTIGYLNICQFGDAYRTLTQLERQHQSWLGKTNQFIKSKKKARGYYNTVAQYLRGKSTQDVNGLPYQVIREIARRRDFLNAQEALNIKEDELTQFSFIHKMIRKDQGSIRWKMKKSKERLAEHKLNLKKAKGDKSLAPFVNEWSAGVRNEKDLIVGYLFKLKVYEDGRRGFLRMKKVSAKRIAREKYKLKEQGGRALVRHLKGMRTQMTKIIENNEFLRYEVFAGSGENIRYQVAGGKTAGATRIPASVKPTKILNWDFDGEYWEDEIGSYRSSLRNNCPKYGRVQNMNFKSK